MVTAVIRVDSENTRTDRRREFGLVEPSSSGNWVGIAFSSGGTTFESLRDKFQERAEAWQDATGHLSAPSRIYSHPTYPRLLLLGRGIIPLILEDIQDGARCDWYPALRALADFDLVLTNLDPVTDAERGNVGLMDAAWLRWGRNNGYID